MTEASAFNARPLATDEDLTLPIVVYVLYLLALPTGGISLIVGLIMAYANRDRAAYAARSHYEFAIRTFWLSIGWVLAGVAACIVGGILSVILIGIPILLVGALMLACGKIWYVVRCILGIAKAAQREAYPRPDALLV
ncbi:MAG: hypothetical protein M3N05_06350 [Pseudomonadota bacterium]|nr:hypothetical protein [Pseudomonadota bacterium]